MPDPQQQHPPRHPAVFRRLLLMLRPHWPAISLGIVLLTLSAPCELFAPLVWGFIADDIALNHPRHPWLQAWFSFGNRLTSPYALLLSATAWMFAVYLVGEALETLESWLLNRVAQKFILGLRNRVYVKLQSQSLGYLQRQRTGDLMSRAMGDVDELQSFIVSGIDQILSEGLLWVTSVVIVQLIDWRVATASLLPLIAVYLLLRTFNRKIKPIYAAAREKLGDVSARLQENLNGITVIKTFNRERHEAARFADATQTYYDHQLRAINARSLFFPFTRVVGFFSNVLMIGVGGYFMLKDFSFTPGDLVAFRGYWWRLFGPITTLARVNDTVQRASAAGRRIFDLLDAPDDLPDSPNAKPLPDVTGALALNDVTFAYPTDTTPRSTGVPPVSVAQKDQDSSLSNNSHGRGARATTAPPVLHNISLSIPPGQTIALAGPSGSGKSTILNLLLRFYDPTAGSVTLDGHDLRSLTKDSLRSHFALVQQESFLFNYSILDNIRYGHPDATLDQVVAAATAANAHDFISKLPHGYDTHVGERGVRLSGGQKQRISIARAFLANPRILLLDEPTSSVEPDSEAAIVAALLRLMKGRTTVLTSHRPSLILQSDYVYVITHGRITEQGPPKSLAQTGGWLTRFLQSPDSSPVVTTPETSTP